MVQKRSVNENRIGDQKVHWVCYSEGWTWCDAVGLMFEYVEYRNRSIQYFLGRARHSLDAVH